jgi:phosphohistidine phosphatase SixA
MSISRSRLRSAIITLLAIFSLIDSRALADSTSLPAAEALIELLRDGGYSLYFRHEATDWSQSDDIRKVGDWLSCDGSRIRQLSSSGRKRATATGQAIQSLGIPIGKVLASPYCRTLETARLMNLGPVESTTDVINLRVAEYFGGRDAIVETAKALLASTPDAETNILIVSHGNVAREATPVYPEEGEGIVFQADGEGGFRLIGRLTAEDWKGIETGSP